MSAPYWQVGQVRLAPFKSRSADKFLGRLLERDRTRLICYIMPALYVDVFLVSCGNFLTLSFSSTIVSGNILDVLQAHVVPRSAVVTATL